MSFSGLAGPHILSGSGSNAIRYIEPVSLTNLEEYEFYVKATALGGAYQISGPYNFIVGCPSSTVFTDSNSYSPLNVFVNQDSPNQVIFTYTPLTSTNVNCVSQSVEAVM